MGLLWPTFEFTCVYPIDPNIQKITSRILQTKQAIVEQEGGSGEELLFLSFWNFDNTILNGDSTEGSVDIYGRPVFKGMAQVAIEAGLSKKYSSFSKFMTDYQAIEKTDEPKAYAYAAQILAGAGEEQTRALSTRYFANTLRPFFFPAALELIRALQYGGVKIIVITASPRIFVQGAAPLLGISPRDIYGMESEVENGRLTDRMVLPLTTGDGKIQKIQQIVQKKAGEGKKVYVLAGIGNYNRNDMPFLEWTASQRLPAGSPLGVIDYHVPPVPSKNMVLMPLNPP